MFKFNFRSKQSSTSHKIIPAIKPDYISTAETFLKDNSNIDRLLSTSPAVLYSRKPTRKYEFTFISENILIHLNFNPFAFCKDYNFWINHVHPEDQENAKQQLGRLLWDHHNTFEYRFQHKNGEYRWIHDRARLICNNKGEPVEIVGSWIDITARKEMEKNLQRSNAFLDSIIENIPDMIFLKDAQDLRFVRFNKAGENLLGFPRQQLLGKNDYDFFPKEEADFFTQKDRNVLSKKKLYDIPEEPIHTKKRGTRYLHTKKIPILDDKGNPTYLLGISEDITDKKKNKEKELKLLSQALRQEKLASIGLLAAGITHEINNPLNGIVGLIHLHHKKIKKTAENNEHIHEILEAANRISQILDNLNSYTTSPTHKKSRININQIIKNTISLCHHQIESDDIRIIKNYEPNLPNITGNKSDIQQLILSLVFNAKDAMPDGGELKIQTGYSDANGCIFIKISDTGIGIEKNDLHRIFDPFFTKQNIGEATGLGLYVVHGIVNKHKGCIDVESKVNEGSRFCIELPVDTAATT